MHNIDENEVLRDALSGLNEEVPPMPEDLHAAWMQKVEADAADKRTEQTRTRKSYSRFLSIAAAMVFVVGGTLLTRNNLPGETSDTGNGKPSPYGVAAANSTGYDFTVEEAAYDTDAAYGAYPAPAATMAPPMAKARSMETDAEEPADAAPEATEKKIIRTASMTIATQTFEDSLAALTAACEGQGGWIESLSESSNSYTGLRTAYLTLRVPQDTLDIYLSELNSLGRVTHRSESARDVTASYQDTQTRLNTQLALMDRLQALITESASLSDLLALERQIADTQYEIDTLQSSLASTDRQVAYSTVTITLQEEKTPELTDNTISFGDRLVSAVQVGLNALLSFLADAVVFLVAAAPFLAIVAIAIIVIRIVRRRKKQ